MSPAKVGVLLINYHQDVLTEACVASLVKQTYKNYKVIVLDNQSRGKLKFKGKAGNGKVRVLYQKRRTGFAAGMNRLIRLALADGCEYLILLNNDTQADPELIEAMAEAGSDGGDKDLTAPVITYLDKPDRVWFGGGRWYQPWFITRHVGLNRHWPLENPGELRGCDWLSGCCIGLKRDFMKHVGWLDERFFMYGEDVDWCYRARSAGGRCRVINRPLLRHAVGATTTRGKNGFNKEKLEWQAQSYARLIRKHRQRATILILIQGAVIWCLIYLGLGRMTAGQAWRFIKLVLTQGR